MSLSEVLDGLHWEGEASSVTTGSGPLFVDSILERPWWARIYRITHNSTDEWEIGTAVEFENGAPPKMPRAPILSCAGLGKAVSFSSGLKQVRFADAVPTALERYMRRVMREDELSGKIVERGPLVLDVEGHWRHLKMAAERGT